jgi:ABC-type branched-subunit amino acid transport system ATPase component
MDNSAVVLDAKQLSIGYGLNTVMSNISFQLKKNEILFVVGQNGSGKSTMLKTIAGLVEKKAGTIYLGKENITGIMPHQLALKGISYWQQNGLVIPDLTVCEHLELTALKRHGKIDKNLFSDIFCEFPKLVELKKSKGFNLSGGERQLLSLAMILIQKSNIWLVDEPTAGLSPDMVNFVFNYFQRKSLEGVTLLIVEHNMDLAYNLATHIMIAKQGGLSQKFDKLDFAKEDFLDKNFYS